MAAWHGTDDDESIALNNRLNMPAVDHTISVDYRRCHALTLSHTGLGDPLVADPAKLTSL